MMILFCHKIECEFKSFVIMPKVLINCKAKPILKNLVQLVVVSLKYSMSDNISFSMSICVFSKQI